MLKAVNLTKKFDDLVAVDHINAEIKSGSVFGLIGTNGAGKSTFLRFLAMEDDWFTDDLKKMDDDNVYRKI